MRDNAIRYLDNQGRVIIPMPIRKSLNWQPGRAVELVRDDDNTLRLRAAQESCAVCGKAIIDDSECAHITREKKLCLDCCEAAVRALERK